MDGHKYAPQTILNNLKKKTIFLIKTFMYRHLFKQIKNSQNFINKYECIFNSFYLHATMNCKNIRLVKTYAFYFHSDKYSQLWNIVAYFNNNLIISFDKNFCTSWNRMRNNLIFKCFHLTNSCNTSEFSLRWILIEIRFMFIL